MSKFLIKLMIFLIPFSVLLLPLTGLFYSGEILLNCRKIARENDKYVFGLAYSEVGRQFKYVNMTERDRFTVAAIGSSRVMQFRSSMFTKSFYNAGGVTQSINEFEDFLRALPEDKLPEYALIGLDQWMFNAAYEVEYDKGHDAVDWDDFSSINQNIGKKVKEFVGDYRAGKIQLIARNDLKEYGIAAMSQSDGFRNDGSYFYSSTTRKIAERDTSFADLDFRSTLDRINKKCCRFNAGDHIDHRSLEKLESLLQFCKERNIKAIAYLPPFATTIFSELVKSGNFEYMSEIYPALKPMFAKYGYELYDFTAFSYDEESNDHEMVDGFHNGESICVKMLIDMVNEGSILREVTDVTKLKSDLDKNYSGFIMYDY